MIIHAPAFLLSTTPPKIGARRARERRPQGSRPQRAANDEDAHQPARHTTPTTTGCTVLVGTVRTITTTSTQSCVLLLLLLLLVAV